MIQRRLQRCWQTNGFCRMSAARTRPATGRNGVGHGRDGVGTWTDEPEDEDDDNQERKKRYQELTCHQIAAQLSDKSFFYN